MRLSTTTKPAPDATLGPTIEPTPEPNPEPTPSEQIPTQPDDPKPDETTLPSYDFTTYAPFDPNIGKIHNLRIHSFELIKTASGRSMKTLDSEVIHHEFVNTVFLMMIFHNHGRLYPRRKKSVRPSTVIFAQESLLSPVIRNIT